MNWTARFGQAELKSGACGKPETAFARVSRSGKRLLSIEAPSRSVRKACATRSAQNNKDTLRRRSRWPVWQGPLQAQWPRMPAPSADWNTKLNEAEPKANTVGNELVIRYNSGMCAHANQEPLPNWSFNRTANGMAPWPRGSVVHHLPRGQGATPLAAG